jgi:ABC-type phosphate/phosphonate transport system substrate-binding protein
MFNVYIWKHQHFKVKNISMIASLPMYDWPEIAGATDAFWSALSSQLGVEGALYRGVDYDAPWKRPDLVFSQTCGYPFTHEFRGKLRYVATPHYDADGCEGPNYCSIVFAREPGRIVDFRGAVAAVNTPESMSGMLALKLVTAPFWDGTAPFFSRKIMTGGHVASMEAVAAGRADVCAIDCVTVALARRHRPHLLAGLREISRSPSVPGLPYVTNALEPEAARRSLERAVADTALEEVRKELLLTDWSNLGQQAYSIIPELEANLVT